MEEKGFALQNVLALFANNRQPQNVNASLSSSSATSTTTYSMSTRLLCCIFPIRKRVFPNGSIRKS